MATSKRIFDVILAILLVFILSPLMAFLAVLILLFDGRPIFYVSERMLSIDDGFSLVKFRTMTTSDVDTGVTGGDKSSRVTFIGGFLRKYRLDELPQLWNILIGDMSFVGPRPPLRQYVRRFPDLYGRVLSSRPGVTGLASVMYHSHEERMLSKCTTVESTNATYERRCVPTKARLDLIYQKNQSLCFDLALMLKTVIRKFPLRYHRR